MALSTIKKEVNSLSLANAKNVIATIPSPYYNLDSSDSLSSVLSYTATDTMDGNFSFAISLLNAATSGYFRVLLRIANGQNYVDVFALTKPNVSIPNNYDTICYSVNAKLRSGDTIFIYAAQTSGSTKRCGADIAFRGKVGG